MKTSQVIQGTFNAVLRFVNSPARLFGVYLWLLTSSGAFYSYFEKKDFFDSVWWAVVTASTVGYGDTYPATWQGRVVAIGLITSMVFFLLPILTAQIASRLIVNADAFSHKEQEQMKKDLRRLVHYIENKDK